MIEVQSGLLVRLAVLNVVFETPFPSIINPYGCRNITPVAEAVLHLVDIHHAKNLAQVIDTDKPQHGENLAHLYALPGATCEV